MNDRKKKLIFFQILLLILGAAIILFTYFNKKENIYTEIMSKDDKKTIEEKLSDKTESGNVFYDIEYSGLDLSGNRYILKSKEAL